MTRTSAAGVLHTAAGNARHAAELVAKGEPATVGWRSRSSRPSTTTRPRTDGVARSSELRSSHLRRSQLPPPISTLHSRRWPSTSPSGTGGLPRLGPPMRGVPWRRRCGGRRRRASTATSPSRRARARSVPVASGSPSAASPGRESAGYTAGLVLLRALRNCSAQGPDLVELVLHKGGCHG